MNIELVKISKVKANKDNPRLIKDDKFHKLVKSIKEFPEMLKIRPIVVNEDMIVLGGNMRLKACKEAGLKEVHIIKAEELTEEKQREFIIKDNAGFGEWDWDIMANEWDADQLNDWGIDTPDLWGVELEAEEDDYEVPDEIKTNIVFGDLIEIGEHRLLCGDSTDSDQVAKLMNGEKADMVFTDPPYNIGFKGSMSNKMVNGKKAPADSANQRHDVIKNDKMSEEQFYNFISDILKEIKINCLGAFYICFGSQTLNQLLQPLLDLGIEYKSIIIWMKNQAIFSGKDFKSRYEPIVYGRFNDFFNGARFNEEDIWQFARTQKNDLHPTMKPIPLIENALNYSSKEGMNILDLFLGSGSTMVAAHQLKRKCYGMELDPKYCQVIIDRMMNLEPLIDVKINGQAYYNKSINKQR
jgi:site-specific DNA-methyltransferase (adenine-specific)